MNLLNKILRKNIYPKQEFQKELAFVSGRVSYYQLSDFNNMPPLRGMKTLVYYEEMQMKVGHDYLNMHTEAMDNILSKNPINVFELKKLNDQLKQRLTIALDMELIYKIASIVFFDEQEDIKDYDFTYNAKKIAHWKQHNADSFFLFKPIKELVPALKDTSVNLQKYFQVVEQMNKMHLDNLLPHLQAKKKSP